MYILLEFVNSLVVMRCLWFLFLFCRCVVELLFCVNKSCLLINLSDFNIYLKYIKNGFKAFDIVGTLLQVVEHSDGTVTKNTTLHILNLTSVINKILLMKYINCCKYSSRYSWTTFNFSAMLSSIGRVQKEQAKTFISSKSSALLDVAIFPTTSKFGRLFLSRRARLC